MSMYVCVCKAVSDKEIRQLIQGGARSTAEIERQCGAGGDCGSCVGDLEAMIDAALLARPAAAGCGRHHRVQPSELSLAA